MPIARISTVSRSQPWSAAAVDAATVPTTPSPSAMIAKAP